MDTTRGGLQAASISEVGSGPEGNPDTAVSCMFNPFEYTVSKTNSFTEQPKSDTTADGEPYTSGPQVLNLKLYFDTYEKGDDVSAITRKLWTFMQPKLDENGGEHSKPRPPMVAFKWGVFYFVSYLTSMTQKFTLFKNDGTPVRAEVDVIFTQYAEIEDYLKKPQNPTSGGGPTQRVWRVVTGDRLDWIAAQVYGDAGKWRLIAQANNLRDPLALRPGQRLRVPQDI
jgi:hypothetical protein